MSLFVLLVLSFASSLLAVADDCAQCTPTALCATHLAAQAAEVKELKPALRDKDPAQRTAAVKKLARVNGEHPLIPSSEIAELVAGALDDEAIAVRTAAAQQLAAELHPEVAVRSLVAALERTQKELAKFGGGGGGRGGYGGGGGGGQDDPKDPKAAEQRRLRQETTQFAQALVESLGRLPDDRSVEALGEFLQPLGRRSGELMNAAAEALVALDCRKGIEAIIQKMKSSPAGGGGGPWGPDTTRRTLHDRLVKVAQEKGIEDMPVWSEKDLPDWEAWLAKNQKQFAAKLGKYDVEKMRKAKE